MDGSRARGVTGDSRAARAGEGGVDAQTDPAPGRGTTSRARLDRDRAARAARAAQAAQAVREGMQGVQGAHAEPRTALGTELLQAAVARDGAAASDCPPQDEAGPSSVEAIEESEGFAGSGAPGDAAAFEAPPPLAAHLAARRGTERAYCAFVLGATGYVGRAVVVELARAGHRTIAHVRPGSARAGLSEALRAAGAEIDRVPLEREPLAAALAAYAPSHVFLCHGTTRARARREGLVTPYESVDVGLTRLALEAAARLASPPRIVLLSAMGAGGRGAYLAARGRAEELVRASGLPFTLCRAPLLTGPDRDERRPAERVAAACLRPALGALGALGLRRLAGRYLPMDAREAAEGLVRSGFHHMTIDRVVLADELRRIGVYERERWGPRSARDQGRH